MECRGVLQQNVTLESREEQVENDQLQRLAKKLMANKSHDLEVENLILTKENDNIFSLVI